MQKIQMLPAIALASCLAATGAAHAQDAADRTSLAHSEDLKAQVSAMFAAMRQDASAMAGSI